MDLLRIITNSSTGGGFLLNGAATVLTSSSDYTGIHWIVTAIPPNGAGLRAHALCYYNLP
jgi:hypothetical protein